MSEPQFLANLEQSENEIRDAWPKNLKFSLNQPFILQKLETELKISNTAHILLL